QARRQIAAEYQQAEEEQKWRITGQARAHGRGQGPFERGEKTAGGLGGHRREAGEKSLTLTINRQVYLSFVRVSSANRGPGKAWANARALELQFLHGSHTLIRPRIGP